MLPIAEALGAASPVTLKFSDFKVGQDQVKGVPTAVAYLDVPIGQFLGLEAKPFTMRLKAQYIYTFVASGTLTKLIDLGAAGLRVAKSPTPAPALPATQHPDILAFISADNGVTWAATPVTVINYVTGQITVTKDAATNAVKVYYLLGEGEISLRAQIPSGFNQDARQLFLSSSKAMHETDQINQRTAITKFTEEKHLSPQMRLEVVVFGAGNVVWNKEAQHEIAIHAVYQPGRVNDRQAVDAAAFARL